jgi:UDP:flavonoid glycosyltransferase YjiC (YdhE family)
LSRILIAWQLGGNYGHLTTDLPVATCLREQGHEVSFVVPFACSSLATELLSPAGFAFELAPRESRQANGPLASYAEIVDAAGAHDLAELEHLIESWSRLIDAVRPAVIVADHAPMAVLAAHSSGTPSVLIGNGFTVPPMVDLLPSIRPWEPIPKTRLQASESALLDRINTLITRSGKPALRTLSQLFADSRAVVTTTWELDPYGPRTQVTYVGPIAADAHAARLDWPPAAKRRVFAYLRPTVGGLDSILTALEQSGAQVICAMPGASAALEKHFAGTQLTLVGRTVPLTPVLAEADAVVSYGGSGVISAALFAGVPMLLAPQNPEQYLNSAQVAKLGAGILIGSRSEPEAIERGLESLLARANHRAAARRYADAHRDHDRQEGAGRAAALIASSARVTPP